MTSRLVGAIGACVLVFLAYAPTVGADTIKCERLYSPGISTAAVPDRASWNTDDFWGRFNATAVNGQLNGSWDFGTVNPFLRDMAREGDDVFRGFQQIGLEEARRFLSSPHASSNSATLVFHVTQTGDRDGDDMDDFHVTLTSAAFTGASASAQLLATPEPASLVLLGSGLVGLVACRVRRRK